VPTPSFVSELLGIRSTGYPNIADKSSDRSVAIAHALCELLGATETVDRVGQTEGALLEQGVKDFLSAELSILAPERPWAVGRGLSIDKFEQYKHLAELDDLIREDESGILSATIGRDYQVEPDVTVGLNLPSTELPLLHASVSCKFTIRSDRVQNVRHEGVILTRHRRGRHPHIVAVTSEPLPSRIAGIARGTGELDAVYHVALPELQSAVNSTGGPGQVDTLEELVGQRRLFNLADLPTNLLQ